MIFPAPPTFLRQPRRFRSTGGIARWILASATGVLGASPSVPAPYRFLHSTLDAGGGTAASSHYRLVSAVGLPGGIARSGTGRFEARQGFIGVLNDPPLARDDTVQRTGGQPGKARVISLISNDNDPDGDRIDWHSFTATSEAGGRVTFDNGWLLYEPPASVPEADRFTYTIEDAAGNVTAAWITVLVAGTRLEPSRNLITASVLPNGHVRLAFAGIAGHRYRVEWTDQLPPLRWEPLANVRADARGRIEWVDDSEPMPPQRYYRTVGQ